MDRVNEGANIIQKAESSLRDLLSKAAQEGNYPAVLKLTSWARGLHDLLGDAGQLDSSRVPNPTVDRNSTSRTSKAVQRLKKKQKEYPTFFRDGDNLIMLAWSKRERKEYSHKASRSVLRSLVRGMMERGAGGRVFATDELLPVRDLTDGKDIPNYKAYVGISFLKCTGVIEQHGRRGYSITRAEEFESSVENLWGQLPVMK